MTKRQKLTGATAAVAAIAIASVMVVRHGGDTSQKVTVRANAMGDEQIVRALKDANVSVDGLFVKSVGGVVVVRGNGDKTAVGDVLKKLNVQRVANLVSPTYKGDDDAIRRDAERQLASSRSLDGCQLRVSCEHGVLRVSGTVRHELQADAARQILRNVRGTKDVKVELVALPLVSSKL